MNATAFRYLVDTKQVPRIASVKPRPSVTFDSGTTVAARCSDVRPRQSDPVTTHPNPTNFRYAVPPRKSEFANTHDMGERHVPKTGFIVCKQRIAQRPAARLTGNGRVVGNSPRAATTTITHDRIHGRRRSEVRVPAKAPWKARVVAGRTTTHLATIRLVRGLMIRTEIVAELVSKDPSTMHGPRLDFHSTVASPPSIRAKPGFSGIASSPRRKGHVNVGVRSVTYAETLHLRVLQRRNGDRFIAPLPAPPVTLKRRIAHRRRPTDVGRPDCKRYLVVSEGHVEIVERTLDDHAGSAQRLPEVRDSVLIRTRMSRLSAPDAAETERGRLWTSASSGGRPIPAASAASSTPHQPGAGSCSTVRLPLPSGPARISYRGPPGRPNCPIKYPSCTVNRMLSYQTPGTRPVQTSLPSPRSSNTAFSASITEPSGRGNSRKPKPSRR